MPAGTSWPRYIGAITGALLSMFLGSQTVHIMYQPLKDLNERVEREKEKMRVVNAKTLSSSESTSSTAPSGASNTS